MTTHKTTFSALFFLLTAVFAWTHPAAAQFEAIEDMAQTVADAVQIESMETSYDQELGIARARGDVLIRYGDATIYAGEAEYHQQSGDIFARRNVSIFKAGQLYRGEEAVYNINTGVIISSDIKSSLGDVYFETEAVTIPTGEMDVIRTENTVITTHDFSKPNWKIKARKITIYPDEYIVFKGATLSAGPVPFMYLPVFAQPLEDELGYYFTPGYNDAWGGYILNRYGFMIGDHTLATANLDYRAERGLAGGIELESMRLRGEPNFGRIEYYYAQDDKPNIGRTGMPRNTDLDSGRYRLNAQHRVYLPGPEESSLYLDIDINKLSDEFFYLDFFPGEFRDDPRPDNIVNLVKNHPRGTISLLGRFQLNDFFQTDTRTPEIAIDATRQSLFGSNFFYEGSTSYAVLEERLADPFRERTQRRLSNASQPDLIDELQRQLDENAFNRFDTFHQVVYPGSVGPVSVVPRAGIGYTDYSDIDGNLFGASSADRTYFHAGVDTSIKFIKNFPGVRKRKLGIDGLRHVFQPYTRYSYINADELGAGFPAIDRLTLSTKLRPLDVTRFTATDAIRDWSIYRVGAFNRLFTRRNGGSYPWLQVNTFVDVFLEDPEFERDYSNLFNELRWSPLPWMSLDVESQLPLGDDFDFTEINTRLSFQPTQNFEFSVGHFYLEDHPFFVDDNNFRFSTYTRLNDNWGFGTVHFYEFTDQTLELQQYTLHRDLASWTAAIGAQVRDNRQLGDEFGIVFALTLKAFPRVGMPVDFLNSVQNRPGS